MSRLWSLYIPLIFSMKQACTSKMSPKKKWTWPSITNNIDVFQTLLRRTIAITIIDKVTNAGLYKDTNSDRPLIPTPLRHWYRLPEDTPASWITKENQTPSWATKTNVGGANPKRNWHKNSCTDNGQKCMESSSSRRDGNLAEKLRRHQLPAFKTKSWINQCQCCSPLNMSDPPYPQVVHYLP